MRGLFGANDKPCFRGCADGVYWSVWCAMPTDVESVLSRCNQGLTQSCARSRMGSQRPARNGASKAKLAKLLYKMVTSFLAILHPMTAN
jgi:hypothetical protein